MATAKDIEAWFGVLNEHLNAVVGAEMQDPDRTAARVLASTASKLLETALIDLNRSADALESLASTAAYIHERMINR